MNFLNPFSGKSDDRHIYTSPEAWHTVDTFSKVVYPFGNYPKLNGLRVLFAEGVKIPQTRRPKVEFRDERVDKKFTRVRRNYVDSTSKSYNYYSSGGNIYRYIPYVPRDGVGPWETVTIGIQSAALCHEAIDPKFDGPAWGTGGAIYDAYSWNLVRQVYVSGQILANKSDGNLIGLITSVDDRFALKDEDRDSFERSIFREVVISLS